MEHRISPSASTIDLDLRSGSLLCARHGLALVCDPEGYGDLSDLTEDAWADYLHARSAIGREFGLSVVYPVAELIEEVT